ncbi:MAG: lipoate--protein ligase family protein [Akkermansiaceae bacterium]
MRVFDHLLYWRDSRGRGGAENMAVDEALMANMTQHPILRIYDWSEPSVSFGYFHSMEEARLAFPSSEECPVHYVRRWTGGGIVDHRHDLTYTLAVPRACELAHQRGTASYQIIHQALGRALKTLGQEVVLSDDDQGSGSVCFEHAVAHDLASGQGEKIAGAGQRRTRHGLLHQGSLLTEVDPDVLGPELANQLAGDWSEWAAGSSFEQEVAQLTAKRYATSGWLLKR